MACFLQAGIPVIYSDARHIPCGVLLPFHQHWQQGGVARAQIGAGAPLKKRLWQAIVRRKVENQAVVLDRAQIEGGRTLRERSEEHTSELQSLMRISYAVFCLKKKKEEETRSTK